MSLKKGQEGNYFPFTLIAIKNFLLQCKVMLSENFDDGRINSSFNEKEIIHLIRANFDISVPKARSWYDFSFIENDIFYPVNIKITETNSADNLNVKLGIYYALTGLMPDFHNEIDWLTYFSKLRENIDTYINKDYYFLVLNKNDAKDIFINSLKGLRKLTPNGNNLPFQCKWKENKEFQKRSHASASKFILKTFGESIKLRSEIYFNFKKYFPEYV